MDTNALRELANALDEQDAVHRDLWVRGRRGEVMTNYDRERLKLSNDRVKSARKKLSVYARL